MAILLCIYGLFTPAHADCLGGQGTNDIVINYLPSDFYQSGDIVDCATSGSITLGPVVSIPDNAIFNLITPETTVKDDFHLSSGGQLHIRTPNLNDTGIITCADASDNDLSCSIADYPGQDAEYGLDVTHYNDSDGHAGFSFTKLDAAGSPLPANAANWYCVKDNVTGLTWEAKSNDGGLHDKDNTYTWYNPDSSTNGGSSGTQNGGNCTGSDCDTLGYVQAVNAQVFCGANNWRMPTKNELRNIVSLDRYNPSIDTDYFPHTRSSGSWSATPYANVSSRAWYVYFNDGRPYDHYKSNFVHVRLVRSVK